MEIADTIPVRNAQAAIDEIAADVYSLVWQRLESEPFLDGEISGACATGAERVVKVLLSQWIGE